MTEYHVVPQDNLWKLHQSGDELARMDSQADAIAAGESRTSGGDTLVINDSDGKVTDRISS